MEGGAWECVEKERERKREKRDGEKHIHTDTYTYKNYISLLRMLLLC